MFTPFEILQVFCIALPRLFLLILATSGFVCAVTLGFYIVALPKIAKAESLEELVGVLAWVSPVAPLFETKLAGDVLVGFAWATVLLSLFVCSPTDWANIAVLVLVSAGCICYTGKKVRRNITALRDAQALLALMTGPQFAWTQEEGRITRELKEELLC